MTTQQQNKILRFAERLPVHLIDHWNEIVDIINDIQKADNVMESESEMRCLFLETKLQKACTNVLVLKQWFDTGKINSKTGFHNMVDFMADDIRKGVAKL